MFNYQVIQNKNKKFELKEEPSFVSVVFYRKNIPIENGEKIPNSAEKLPNNAELNFNEEKIIEFLQNSTKIVSEDVEKLLGVKERRAREILSNMAKKGILQKIGKTKGSYYILKENRC